MNTKTRFQRWFWIALTDLLLGLEKRGWKQARRVVYTPLIVLILNDGPGSSPKQKPGKREVPMFGLKIKLWIKAVRFAFWLKRAIEIRAAKSVGLIGGGAMLVDRKGEILDSYLKSINVLTVFGPN